jgi:hypothetical protein
VQPFLKTEHLFISDLNLLYIIILKKQACPPETAVFLIFSGIFFETVLDISRYGVKLYLVDQVYTQGNTHGTDS